MKHDSRNLKYGSTAIILSVVLIAAIIMLNVIFYALTSKYAFYSDMTKNSTYTLSNEVKDVLSDVTEEVNIIFCHDRDYIDSSSTLHDVLATAENLAEEYEWLNVKFINILKDPNLVQKYKTSSEDTVLQTNVIIESGEEYRKLNDKAFYVVDSDGTTVWGFQAEEKFASAILSVTAAEMPIAYVTTTHLETISVRLSEIVSNAGYELRPLDLQKDEIDPDARLIIINNPKKDFTGGEGSELEKLEKFLSGDFGSMMVFLDPYGPDLKNLEAMLYEWGVIFDNNIIKDETQSISVDGNAIVAEYCTDKTLGSNLIDEIASLATRPKTIFNDTGTISINPNFTHSRDADESDPYNQTSMGIPNGAFANGYKDVSPVFVTSSGALSYSTDGTGDGTAAGGANLMTISRQLKTVNNEYYSSYVLCANTASFNDDDWILSNTYGNEDVIYAALKQFGREVVPSGIEFKETANYDIEDMTTSEATSWTAVLIFTPIAVFTVLGVVVCIRRRYK